ncbi:MAG: hypothetical protein KAT31_02340 [Bacteroidales bacterium]|nr:hypothetical protein [Bacteroidales bacterium]
MRLRIIYSLHDVVQPGPDWPNVGFDFAPVMERIDATLIEHCPNFEFISSMASGPEDAEKILEQDKNSEIGGYIVFQMNCWNRVVQTIATSAKPVLYADFQYAGSGGFLVYTAGFIREEMNNVGFIASSDMVDLIKAVNKFNIIRRGGTTHEFVAATKRVRQKRTPSPGDMNFAPDDLTTISPEECVRQMKSSRILAVRDEQSSPAEPIMNIPMEFVSFSVLNEAWKAADREEARSIADRWQSKATEVKDVSFETLENSAAMYLGMKEVLKTYDANAISVNCLGGFYGGHIHAYPCLGFHELNNEGLVGACECDVRSTATMVAFTAMTGGRPGYISDPVIDTAKRQIIYAHCVASNKVFGPDGAENPFSIMTHSEDRQGASVRSIMPAGYLTTTLEIAPQRKEILMHQAKAVGNDPDDRACRTKLCAEPVGDIEKLFTMWDQWGWHRVTFYGDLKEPAYALADAIGWKVIEEA